MMDIENLISFAVATNNYIPKQWRFEDENKNKSFRREPNMIDENLLRVLADIILRTNSPVLTTFVLQ